MPAGPDDTDPADPATRARQLAERRVRPALTADAIELVRSIAREVYAERSRARERLAWSPVEAAQAVNLPPRRIYNAIHRGELPALRNGRHLRIADRELRRWVGEQDDAPEHRTAS